MDLEADDYAWATNTCLDYRLVCASCQSKIFSTTARPLALHVTGNVCCRREGCSNYSVESKFIDTRNLPPEFIPSKKYAAILKKYSEAPMQSSTSAGQTTSQNCSDNKSLLYKRLSEVTKELSNIHEQLSITLPKKKELEIEYSNITKQLLNNRDQSEDDVLL